MPSGVVRLVRRDSTVWPVLLRPSSLVASFSHSRTVSGGLFGPHDSVDIVADAAGTTRPTAGFSLTRRISLCFVRCWRPVDQPTRVLACRAATHLAAPTARLAASRAAMALFLARIVLIMGIVYLLLLHVCTSMCMMIGADEVDLFLRSAPPARSCSVWW